MYSVDAQLLVTINQYVQGALSDFLPLFTVVVGTFIAFAIANMLRHYIKKML